MKEDSPKEESRSNNGNKVKRKSEEVSDDAVLFISYGNPSAMQS
jgi:hypothetical protein